MENIKKKKCAKCKRILLAEEFPTDNRSKDKLWRYCRKCESDTKKKYRETKNFQNDNSSNGKVVRKKDSLPIYFRLKSRGCGDLAHVHWLWYRHTDKAELKYVSYSLPRIYNIFRSIYMHREKYPSCDKEYEWWNKVFSEVMSHESLHIAIYKATGQYSATSKLDKIAGHLGRNSSDIGRGLSSYH